MVAVLTAGTGTHVGTLPVVVGLPAEPGRPMTRTGPCQTGFGDVSRARAFFVARQLSRLLLRYRARGKASITTPA
jgi:hypothetical protein